MQGADDINTLVPGDFNTHSSRQIKWTKINKDVRDLNNMILIEQTFKYYAKMMMKLLSRDQLIQFPKFI